MCGVMLFVFQDLLIMTKACSPGKGLNICLLMGSTELIPLFALPACAAFAFPIKLSLFQPMRFFTFLIFFPIPCGEVRTNSCVRLSCLPELTHKNHKREFWIKYLSPITLEHLDKHQLVSSQEKFYSLCGWSRKTTPSWLSVNISKLDVNLFLI